MDRQLGRGVGDGHSEKGYEGKDLQCASPGRAPGRLGSMLRERE